MTETCPFCGSEPRRDTHPVGSKPPSLWLCGTHSTPYANGIGCLTEQSVDCIHRQIAKLTATVAEQDATIEEMRDWLIVFDDQGVQCAECDADLHVGSHAADCRLAKLIGGK